MEEVTRKLKRVAADLGIDLIDLKTTVEEEELLQHCKLPLDLGSKGKLCRLIREEQKPPVFLVSAVIKGALRSQGARGNIYKALEKHQGLFSESEGKQVTYDGDDLAVKAYFRLEEQAMSFQSALNGRELHKTLILLDGIKLDPPDPVSVHRPHDLSRFYSQHYQPNESESPCQTLNQLESYRLSVPITEAVEPSDPPQSISHLIFVLEETNPTSVT